MRHLQRFSSFDQDAVLGADPRAHHHSGGGGQPQGAGAGDGQNRDGGLEGEADDDLGPGELLVGTLRPTEPLSTSRLLSVRLERLKPTGKFCSTTVKLVKPTSSQAASVSRDASRMTGTKTPPSRSASF